MARVRTSTGRKAHLLQPHMMPSLVCLHHDGSVGDCLHLLRGKIWEERQQMRWDRRVVCCYPGILLAYCLHCLRKARAFSRRRRCTVSSWFRLRAFALARGLASWLRPLG